ncbi:MAG: ABC transporter permease subunit [Fimbriimonadales bacterium]|nr:ABC transporter permease subunit [Fimbriimonadales bacterium]
MRLPKVFFPGQNLERRLTWADALILLGIVALIGFGVQLAKDAPEVVRGPEISLSPAVLPVYAALSTGRMLAAYLLSLAFSIAYGYWAANSRRASKVLLPLLDILQSVPILSFLPVVLLSLSAILPQKIATELASILLIFTSQAWNLTFSWYQSLTTIPKDLREAAGIFQLNSWMRFKTLQLPFGMIGLIWNSMMSWAGGWFFLMAAEIFNVGERDFRLPGLGSYLQEAAHQGNTRAILFGLATLTLVIVALDQLVWRPFLAWSHRFRLDMVHDEDAPTSWFYDVLMDSSLMARVRRHWIRPMAESFDLWIHRRAEAAPKRVERARRANWTAWVLTGAAAAAIAYGGWRAVGLLVQVPAAGWGQVLLGILTTLLRVTAALAVTLAWTIPVGVAIGTNPRLARWLQPLAQLAASIPATALFPVFLAALVSLAGGLNIAAIALMMAGTQWYLLFNVIAGASAIPRDLHFTAELMKIRGWERWKVFLLPSLFPYLITGSITASGGAWNASIVAEYAQFSGQTLKTLGAGAIIADSTARGDFPLLLAGTLAMVFTVVMVNRLLWRRLYKLAEDRFRMD